jgi:hypothetical protein
MLRTLRCLSLPHFIILLSALQMHENEFGGVPRWIGWVIETVGVKCGDGGIFWIGARLGCR